jgi:tetratricopeptide (TPR) repeat protein
MAEEVKRLIEATPEELQIMMEAGNVYYQRGKYPEAEKLYAGALVLEPGNPDIHAHLGAAYHMQGKKDEAIEEYEKAVAGCDKNECAYCNLGELLLDKGEIERARQELEKAVELDPDGPAGEKANLLLKKINS